MDLKIKLEKILEAKKVTMSNFKFGTDVQSERLCLAYNVPVALRGCDYAQRCFGAILQNHLLSTVIFSKAMAKMA